MKRIIVFAGIFIALISAQSSFAQRTPRINHRQARQQHRIQNGVRSGELTPREAGHLEHREARLRHDRRAAKADGVVTARERQHLSREQNRNSRAIYRQKHDRQVAH